MTDRRRKPPNPLPRIVVALLTLLGLYAIQQSGAIEDFAKSFVQMKSTPAPYSSYARRTADQLYDTPTCKPYRDAILAHEGESSASAATVSAIAKAYDAGKAAGCRKPE